MSIPVAGTASLPPRRRDIQGLRALAVVVVVAYHAGLPVPGGFFGVDMFFVISGFVITGMLHREFLGTGRIALVEFYKRRFRRLAPALSVVIVITMIGSALLLSPLGVQQNVIFTALGSLGIVANLVLARTSSGYFDPAASTNPLLHIWSLSVEEQFYLVFPFVLILGWWMSRRLPGRTPWGLLFVIVIGGLSILAAFANAQGHALLFVPADFLGFYGPIGRAWEFATGAALALIISRRRMPSGTASLLASLFGLALVGYALFALSETASFPSFATLIPVTGVLLLLFAGTNGNAVGSRLLGALPAVTIGDLSYSWYLWHWPFIVFAVAAFPGEPVALVAAGILALAPAYASYRWIEQPIRSVRAVGGRRLTVLVVATLATPLLFVGALHLTVVNGYWNSTVREMQSSVAQHEGVLGGCMSPIALTSETQHACEWNADASGRPIYLVGDSVAEHYSEGVIAAGERLDRPVTIATASSCPTYHVVFTAVGEAAPVDHTSYCNPFIDGTLDWLDEQPAGTVIIGGTDVLWWNPSDVIPPPLTFAASVQARTDGVIAGMTETVRRLQAAGHTVVLAKAPPSYRYPEPGWDKTDCSTIEVASGSCATSAPLKTIDRLQAPARAIIDTVADATGASVADFRNFFCSENVCATQRGGLTLYRDDIHISVDAAKALTPQFEKLLRSN